MALNRLLVESIRIFPSPPYVIFLRSIINLCKILVLLLNKCINFIEFLDDLPDSPGRLFK